MEKQQKNPFANVDLSDDAIKLANAIYNTYLQNQEDDPYLSIHVKKLCAIFGYDCNLESIAYLRSIFDELNEPIVVTDFEYGNKIHDWTILQFCEFEKNWNDGDVEIDIYLEEMYFVAMKKFMEKPFVNVR